MIKTLDNLTLDEIAKLKFDCTCTMNHSTEIHHIIIGSNILHQLVNIVAQQEKSSGAFIDKANDKLLVVCDIYTKQVAGDTVIKILSDAGYCVDLCYFPQEELIASKQACDIVKSHIKENTSLLIAVGAGTLNDITKYAAFQTELPFYIVATAPSMDGYASTVAPMIVNGLKYALEAKGPDAIIGDIDIIRKAPKRLMAAGFGDLVGKCVSICDWKLSHLVTDESFCPLVADTVLKAVQLCADNVDGLLEREPSAVQNVMEALIICGLMMNYVKSSRPASGSEHGLDHFWELAQIFDEKPVSLHGEGVGVGSIVSCVLYQSLRNQVPDVEMAEEFIANWDISDWEANVKRFCKLGADDVLEMENKFQKNQPHTALPRLKATAAKWPQILQAIHTYIPDPKVMEASLKRAQGLTTPQEMGLSKQNFVDAIRYAKDTRYRYSVLQLLWDLGLMDQYVEIAEKYFYS